MTRIILLFFIFFSFIYQLKGQSSIKGKLVDNIDKTPIEYGSVLLYNHIEDAMVNGSISKADGIFEIENVAPGDYYLIAKFLGYDSLKVSSFSLNKQKEINLGVLYLAPNQQFLNEVEVTGDKLTALHQIDKQVYTAAKFQSGIGGTAVDILRNLPGLNINANGDISVRGTNGFLIMLNGKPIQSDPKLVLNQFPANTIENIEIITAPSAKFDPDGKAGIINIILKEGAETGLFLMVNTRLGLPSIEDYDNAENASRYGGDFTLSYRTKKWDLALGASYQKNDISGRREGDVFTIINDTLTRFPSDGERSFDEYTLSGRFSLGFKPDKSNTFQLGINGGKRSKDRTADILYFDNHAFVIPNGERLYTHSYFNENLRIRKGDFFLGSFDYSHVFPNKSALKTSLLYEYTLLGGPTTNRNLSWPNTTEVVQDEFNTNDNPLNGTRLQIDYDAAAFSFGKLSVGYLYRNLDHKGDFIYTRKNLQTNDFELVPAFSSTVNLIRRIHAVYGELAGNEGRLSYSAGARVELMDRELLLQDRAGEINTTFNYDFLKLYPAFNLAYQFNETLQLKTAYSKRVERTTTFKMNPFPEREHSETLEQGDPDLLPEFIDLVELGLVKNIKEQTVFATLYYRDVQNLINRVNTVFNDTILNRIYSNVGNGRTWGVELGAELKLTEKWKAFGGINIFHTNIVGDFAGREVDNSNWMYTFNANTTVDIAKSWNAQFTLNYLSERITAQGEDSRFFSPNLTVRKTFMDGRLTATLQWLNMDLGLWDANEQRISTSVEDEFFTTTNYVYEVDMVLINFSYLLNKSDSGAKFIESEFGEKEF